VLLHHHCGTHTLPIRSHAAGKQLCRAGYRTSEDPTYPLHCAGLWAKMPAVQVEDVVPQKDILFPTTPIFPSYGPELGEHPRVNTRYGDRNARVGQRQLQVIEVAKQ